MRFTVSNQQWNIYYKTGIENCCCARAVVYLKMTDVFRFPLRISYSSYYWQKIQSWCEAKEMSHILYMPSYFLPRNNELFAVSIFLFWIFIEINWRRKNIKTMAIWKLEGIFRICTTKKSVQLIQQQKVDESIQCNWQNSNSIWPIINILLSWRNSANISTNNSTANLFL